MRISWVWFLLTGASTLACGGSSKPPEATSSTAAASVPTTVTSFTRSPQSQQVDKVGGSDGSLAPDGFKDLVFMAEIDGPVTALFVVSTDAAGAPDMTFRVDTLIKDQKVPKEVGVDAQGTGGSSAGIGAFEGEKNVNSSDGSLKPLGAGHHTLTLYCNDTGVLHAGDHVRLFALDPRGGVVVSKILDL